MEHLCAFTIKLCILSKLRSSSAWHDVAFRSFLCTGNYAFLCKNKETKQEERKL